MNTLILRDDLFIGKGLHKKTYIHPEDEQLCIKVAYGDEGELDLEREIRYRALRDKQGLRSSLLPMYIGGG